MLHQDHLYRVGCSPHPSAMAVFTHMPKQTELGVEMFQGSKQTLQLNSENALNIILRTCLSTNPP